MSETPSKEIIKDSKESDFKPFGFAVGGFILFSVLRSTSVALASTVLLILSIVFILHYKEKKSVSYQIVRGLAYAFIAVFVIGFLVAYSSR